MDIKDGFYDGVITSCKVIKSRFNQEGVLELCFTCGYYDADKKPAGKCEVYLELSNRYGMGNDANRMWWQITKERLDRLGWTGDLDLTKVGQMVNKPCRLSYSTADRDGHPLKGGPRWSFSFRRENVEIDGATANAMLAQMMGGTAAAPSAKPASPFAAPQTAPNPFDNM